MYPGRKYPGHLKIFFLIKKPGKTENLSSSVAQGAGNQSLREKKVSYFTGGDPGCPPRGLGKKLLEKGCGAFRFFGRERAYLKYPVIFRNQVFFLPGFSGGHRFLQREKEMVDVSLLPLLVQGDEIRHFFQKENSQGFFRKILFRKPLFLLKRLRGEGRSVPIRNNDAHSQRSTAEGNFQKRFFRKMGGSRKHDEEFFQGEFHTQSPFLTSSAIFEKGSPHFEEGGEKGGVFR